MTMLSPNLDDVTIDELERLIETGVSERNDLEFKYMLNPAKEKHKKKFLREVISFANTDGGDLLIGVPDPDDDNLDKSLKWITEYSDDKYKLKWEDILRTGTQPQLDSHKIRTIQNPDGGGFVTIVRVRKSMLSPHRVTSYSSNDFYARNSAGTYKMDVNQLRDSFLEQYRLTEQVEEFLAERISKIRAGNTPAPYEPGPSMILHVIPTTAFGLQPEIDISPNNNERAGLSLLHRNGSGSHYAPARRNIDGIVNSRHLQPGEDMDDNPFNSEYVQLFRDGRIEAVHSYHFRSDFDEENRIGFRTLYEILRDRLPEYTTFLFDRGVGTPVFLYLSFIDAEGYVIATGQRKRTEPLDRKVATLPAVTVESGEDSAQDTIKKLLQEVWYAFGQTGEPYEILDDPNGRY